MEACQLSSVVASASATSSSSRVILALLDKGQFTERRLYREFCRALDIIINEQKWIRGLGGSCSQ